MQAVLKYPFIVDMFAFNTYQEGYDHVYSEFYALEELKRRDDYGSVLIDTYQNIPVIDGAESRGITGIENIFELAVLEVLIAQPEMTDILGSEEINTITEIALEKYQEKCESMDVYAGNVSIFFDSAEENPDSEIARAALSTVTTPNGTAVTVINTSSQTDFTASEINSYNSYYDSAYPRATRLRNPTVKYNCHSYAWYSTSSSNHYWMNNPSSYMTDGSYSSTSSSDIGNKVIWGAKTSPEHSGILAKNANNSPYVSCNSKWGNLGLYNHPLDDCPYSGSRTYWTR